jgi:hypothetical protein
MRELGWIEKAFSPTDKDIASDSYRRYRNRRTSRRIDSYAEKYCWIAYYEQTGMRADLGLIKPWHRDNSHRTSDVDIDPSFPDPPKEEQLTSENWLAGAQKTLSAWIRRGSVPDTTPLLRPKAISGDRGPWLMLDGYISQQDKVSGRSLFCFVRAFLIQKKDQRDVVRALKKQSMRNRWPPEKPSEIYAFAGEFPWCSSFDADYATTLRFVTERKMVTVMRGGPVIEPVEAVGIIENALQLLRQKKPIPKKLMSAVASVDRTKLFPVQEVREKATEFKATIPVCDFNWEGPTVDDVSVNGILLAKPIAQALNLRWISGTLDVADMQGRRATQNTSFGAEVGNRQHGFFVREDLLVKYLRRTKQALVWISWGERQITHHWADHVRQNRDEFGEPFKVFHTVKIFAVSRNTPN